MAIAFVKEATGSAFSTTATATFGSNTTAGNLVVALVGHQGQATATITDSGGHTWTLAATTNGTGATSQRLNSLYYCFTTSAISWVTATMGGTSAIQLNASEWSGAASFHSPGNSGNDSSAPLQAAVDAAAGDLIIGLGTWTLGTRGESLSSPFTALTATAVSTTYAAYAYYLAPSATTDGPTYTGAAATFGLSTAAFSPPSYPPPRTPLPNLSAARAANY